MSPPRVLLTTLSIRTSAAGREYLSGYLGKARVVAFAGEPDRFGNPTWDVFVASPEPREGDAAAPRRSPPDQPLARANGGSSAYRAPRRESAAARQERVAGEVAARYGVQGDSDLSDEIPF